MPGRRLPQIARRGRAPATTALALGAFLAAPSIARADVIYGCWSFEGETLEVTAESVVTPGGAQPAADIGRHRAAYVAPPGERDAGQRIVFNLLNEELLARRVERGLTGELAMRDVEYWTPCEAAAVS